MRKLATTVIAAVIGVAPVLATATTASAEWRQSYKNGKPVRTKPHYNNGNDVNWGGVGAGFVAGAAVGVGAGLLINRPPPPVYYAPPPPPVYYAPPPVVYYQVPAPAPSPAYYYPPEGVYYDGGYTEAHVEWCLDRYRSYNPATNTFTGYDGYQRECRGPY